MTKDYDVKELQNKTYISFEKTIKRGVRRVILSVTIAMIILMAIFVIVIKFL